MALAKAALLRKLRNVRVLLLDVDGVLTDAGMYYGDDGTEWKRFSTRDGMGIGLVQRAGVTVGLVTQEESPIVARRAQKLRIALVYQGAVDKSEVLKAICSRLDCAPREVAYVGDDVNDLGILTQVGVGIAVGDAIPELKQRAHYVTGAKGGHGAVRETCELLLAARSRQVR